jgi:hypothetical protein
MTSWWITVMITTVGTARTTQENTGIINALMVVAHIQSYPLRTVASSMAAMFMVMAVRIEITIALVALVSICTQIGKQIIMTIWLIIARVTRCGNAGFYIISPAITALAQIIRAG